MRGCDLRVLINCCSQMKSHGVFIAFCLTVTKRNYSENERKIKTRVGGCNSTGLFEFSDYKAS